MAKTKKIGIFSGKGGVGKTSITASLAVLMQKNNRLLAVDTDVDAPNLAILFQAEGKPVDTFSLQTTEKASFLEDKCTHCKLCVNEKFCHFDAISWNEAKKIPVIDNIACEGCHACKYLCPEQAFEINPVDSGRIMHLTSNYTFDVITGETILGSQTSGKLVSELKNYAAKIAQEQKIETMLIDGPPGIGCPVIAAMANLDYIIVIIEPTQVALHDATRLMEVVLNFEIPIGVIINKADMFPEGLDQIKEFLNRQNIPILGEIQLDEKWPSAIAIGKPIVVFDPQGQSAKSITQIQQKLEKL